MPRPINPYYVLDTHDGAAASSSGKKRARKKRRGKKGASSSSAEANTSDAAAADTVIESEPLTVEVSAVPGNSTVVAATAIESEQEAVPLSSSSASKIESDRPILDKIKSLDEFPVYDFPPELYEFVKEMLKAFPREKYPKLKLELIGGATRDCLKRLSGVPAEYNSDTFSMWLSKLSPEQLTASKARKKPRDYDFKINVHEADMIRSLPSGSQSRGRRSLFKLKKNDTDFDLTSTKMDGVDLPPGKELVIIFNHDHPRGLVSLNSEVFHANLTNHFLLNDHLSALAIKSKDFNDDLFKCFSDNKSLFFALLKRQLKGYKADWPTIVSNMKCYSRILSTMPFSQLSGYIKTLFQLRNIEALPEKRHYFKSVMQLLIDTGVFSQLLAGHVTSEALTAYALPMFDQWHPGGTDILDDVYRYLCGAALKYKMDNLCNRLLEFIKNKIAENPAHASFLGQHVFDLSLLKSAFSTKPGIFSNIPAYLCNMLYVSLESTAPYYSFDLQGHFLALMSQLLFFTNHAETSSSADEHSGQSWVSSPLLDDMLGQLSSFFLFFQDKAGLYTQINQDVYYWLCSGDGLQLTARIGRIKEEFTPTAPSRQRTSSSGSNASGNSNTDSAYGSGDTLGFVRASTPTGSPSDMRFFPVVTSSPQAVGESPRSDGFPVTPGGHK